MRSSMNRNTKTHMSLKKKNRKTEEEREEEEEEPSACIISRFQLSSIY